MVDGIKRIEIDSEQKAWDTLQAVLNKELDPEKIELSFDHAEWAKFSLYMKGERFHQSLPASSMKALVELQNSLYRSVGTIINNDGSITKLTDEEKSLFELTYYVGNGSSSILADGQTALIEAAKLAVGKMSGRQIVIVVLGFSLLFFASSGIEKYMDSSVETTRIESQSKKDQEMIGLTKHAIDTGKQNIEIISEALRASPRLKEINENHENAVDFILKNSVQADEIKIQGMTLTKENIRSLTRVSRRKSERKPLSGKYIVTGIDSSQKDVFRVRLQSENDEQTSIVADLDDPIVIDRVYRRIQISLRSKKAIRVRMQAKIVGDEVHEAKIISATLAR